MTKQFKALTLLGLLFIITGLLMSSTATIAQDSLEPLHPPIMLLDAAGNNVLESGASISAMATCGTCHDTDFIAQHSIHGDGGLHNDVAQLVWQPESTGAEMNCFMCHTDTPNNTARLTALADGLTEWATTATLEDIAIINAVEDSWSYDVASFGVDGTVSQAVLPIIEPADANCAQCHGVTHPDAQIALNFDIEDTTQWQTLTTGQVFSPQRISNSGLNIANKNDLTRTWDVHAERVVNCIDCHYSLNNPIFYEEGNTSRPDHLIFDPRRMEFGDYLQRPLHQFANSRAGETGLLAEQGRDCADCHDAVSTHTWLPYTDGHMAALACETCHIPTIPAGALAFADYTVANPEGEAVLGYRGMQNDSAPKLIDGAAPVILQNDDGKLAPHNLITVWYWVSEGEVIPQNVMQTVFNSDDVFIAFDTDNDGTLNDDERRIQDYVQHDLITSRLAELGYADASVVSEIQTYPIHHGVTHGEWAIRDCTTCHSDDSILVTSVMLADRTPDGVIPTFTGNASISTTNAGLTLLSDVPDSLYIFGNDSVGWVDWLGIGLFLATLLGVVAHGGIRYMAARRAPAPHEPELREVYMYTIYERQWHWLQSAAIFGLIFTGLVIHKPQMFSLFSFRYMVLVHNALALILIINAALAAFYHLASGEIRQYLPEPRGFFGKMFAQAKYYLWGIFHNAPHPFEKTPEQKLNPIQQLTYFGLLNVLLPLQVITGALMWGAQRFPDWTAALGGLPFLAPFHALIAWLLATFIVLHVYMTTTGHTPLANIKAMIGGWDEVETYQDATHTNEPIAHGGD